MLERLGEIYQKEGVKPGEIAHKIAEETGMSYTWVMKYLPEKFKDDVKSESARATRRVAEEDPKRVKSLKRARVLPLNVTRAHLFHFF